MSEALPVPFDYTQLEISTQVIVSQAAANIRAHGKLATQSIIAIGAELTKVKEAIGHGNYLAWIDAEFGWSDRTARNYVWAYEAFKSETVSDLEPIDTKALYLLAAPSTPKPVREAALQKAATGERVTQAGVRLMLSPTRGATAETAEVTPDADAEAAEKEQEQPEPEEAEEVPFDWTADTLTRINEVINLTKWGAKTTAAEIDPTRRAVIAKKAEKAHRWLRMLARELKKLELQDQLRGPR
jgi:hypothetical protein